MALLGEPVAHSLSPHLHNAAFRAQGLNLIYVAAPVAPKDLPAAVEGLRALCFRGANVTIPHKEAVVPLLDALSERARAVGAVNTIVRAGNALRGDNTDVPGFLAPLEAHAERLHGTDMLIFGAGGAARAVAYALLTRFRPQRLTLAARRPEQAERLARDLAAHDTRGALAVTSIEEAGPRVRASRLLVNATPLGMHPETEETPWPHREDFSEGQIVYDLVYHPTETRLLREAAARGATPLGGLEMLLGQAAESYRQWTGREMPVETVRRALAECGGTVPSAAPTTSGNRARQAFEGYLAKSDYLSSPAFFDDERGGFVVVHSGHHLEALGGELPTARYFARKGVWVELLNETGPGPFADARHFGPRGDGRLWEYKTPEPGRNVLRQVQGAISSGKRPSGNIVIRFGFSNVHVAHLNRGVKAALLYDQERVEKGMQPLVRHLVILYAVDNGYIEERRTPEEFLNGELFRGP